MTIAQEQIAAACRKWDKYVESMGSVMGDTERMAQEMRDMLEQLAVDNARLRELIKRIKKDADEWCISRMTGNLELENQKGERMWKTIRNASASTAPIEPSAALQEKPHE